MRGLVAYDSYYGNTAQVAAVSRCYSFRWLRTP